MSITPHDKFDPANELFFLRATLTQPVALDGRLDFFREESKLALSSTRPASARNWSVQLETPARCVIRTILSAPSEQEAAQQVLRAVNVAFGALEIQPGHVAVKAPSIYVEGGYLPLSDPKAGLPSSPIAKSPAGPNSRVRRRT
jgi:hypothetical protein